MYHSAMGMACSTLCQVTLESSVMEASLPAQTKMSSANEEPLFSVRFLSDFTSITLMSFEPTLVNASGKSARTNASASSFALSASSLQAKDFVPMQKALVV